MKILILGGGISGLSAAWYLRKKYRHAKITLLEKEERLGGVVQTMEKDGSFFEMGPRTFVVSRSSSLLQLIEEVGLKDEILFSSKEASQRFLWHRGSLKSQRSFLGMAACGLFREMFVPKKSYEDESIYDYATRRLNSKIAETLFDPMVLGVYSGDMRKLSLRSCFPFLYDWEQKGLSILRGMMQGKKDGRLFTLKTGMGSLIEAMQKQVDAEIIFRCPVQEIAQDGVVAGGAFWGADKIVSALPGPTLGRLTKSWIDFPSRSIWVVNLGFKADVLSCKGFGYLIPTQEKESVLGMVWDSSVFQRKQGIYQTILTAMVRDSEEKIEESVRGALQRHLGCMVSPDFMEMRRVEEAIPQFEVGYAKRLAKMQSVLQERFPSLILTGNYLEGASVDACIRHAKGLFLSKHTGKSFDFI